MQRPEPKLTFSLGYLPEPTRMGWLGSFQVLHMDPRFQQHRFLTSVRNPAGDQHWAIRSMEEPEVCVEASHIYLWGNRSGNNRFMSAFQMGRLTKTEVTPQAIVDSILLALQEWATLWPGWNSRTMEETPDPSLEVREALPIDIPLIGDEDEDESPAPLFVEPIKVPNLCLF